MSQENVERMHRSLERFDRRDKAAWIALRDPDSVVLPDDNFPEGGAIRGREAAWDFYIKTLEAFDSVPIADVDIVEAGTDKVLVHQRNQLRGKASGVAVELDYWIVVTFRKGLMLRDEWFSDRADALEAAGLSE